MRASGFRDLEIARAWASDDATSETMLARLYQQWPAVHAELAANPRTPAHLLARLANSSDPTVAAALSRNPTAIASSIRPRATWPPPTALPPEPSPLGVSLELHCPNPSCQAIIRPEQVRCFACGAALRSDAMGAIPATASNDTAAFAATAAIPVVTQFGQVPVVVAPPASAPPRQSAAATAGAAEPAKLRWQDRPADAFHRVRARVGAVGLIVFFAALFFVALTLLVLQTMPRGIASNKAATDRKYQPAAPSGAVNRPATPSSPVTIAGSTTLGRGATTSRLDVKTTVTSPATTATAAETTVATTTKTTAKAVVTTTPAAKSTTTTTTTISLATSLVPKAGPSVTESRLTALAQEYASALATKNTALVLALNPGQGGDLSGYKSLIASTVFPVTIAGTSDPYVMKLGLVAHENTATDKQTVLYCATYSLDLGQHAVAVSPTGRKIRTTAGIVDPASYINEINRVCR